MQNYSLDELYKTIDRYLKSETPQPRIINFQSRDDLAAIKAHYNVPINEFLDISKYCDGDYGFQIPDLLYDLQNARQPQFLTGFTTYMKLYGESGLRDFLLSVLNLNTSVPIILLSYQCYTTLSDLGDIRQKTRIGNVGTGTIRQLPKLVFMDPAIPSINTKAENGLVSFVKSFERAEKETIYIKTKARKSDFPKSVYLITENKSAFDSLQKQDFACLALDESWGTEAQWNTLLKLVIKSGSLNHVIAEHFGSPADLPEFIGNWDLMNAEKQWLYYIALKCFQNKENRYLPAAAACAKTFDELPKEIYRCILSQDRHATDYPQKYQERRRILRSVKACEKYAIDFVQMAREKGKYALYYYTDTSRAEKEAMLDCLDLYYYDYTKEEIKTALEMVYPDLSAYIQPYHFGKPLTDAYFERYAFQKAVNHMDEAFLEMVQEQATLQEFFSVLPRRTEIVDALPCENAEAYFVDALGVEFLSFLSAQCKEHGIKMAVKPCMCELPSITALNKEFTETFAARGVPLTEIGGLDSVKHQGKERYDWQKTKLPIHLIEELEILKSLLTQISQKLATGQCARVFIVSDHGASRFARLYDDAESIDYEGKGSHGGRIAEFIEGAEVPANTLEKNGYLIMTGYDRFKGGRANGVECHGGAALEEVCVPVITLTMQTIDYEIKVISEVIRVSFKDKAVLKFFSKTKLSAPGVSVNGKYYPAEDSGNGFYCALMEDITKKGAYTFRVLEDQDTIAENLSFRVEKGSGREKELF